VPNVGRTSMRIVERRSHKFAQRFQELVGVSHQVCPFSLWQAIETGLIVAKEHKNVVEGLVVERLAETRARSGLAILLERDDANRVYLPGHDSASRPRARGHTKGRSPRRFSEVGAHLDFVTPAVTFGRRSSGIVGS
jgi:hypothetical protein